MVVPEWLLANHLALVLVGLVALTLSRSVLRERRPAGSAFAWLFVLLFLPYIGIPLYLALGSRKIRRRARRKRALHAELVLKLPSTCSHLEWLDDGVQAYQAFLRGIEQAQRCIRIVTFVIADDEAGRNLLRAMIRRARQGVEVRLLLDDFLRFRAPRDLLTELVQAGGRVERFMPLLHLPFRARTNLRNHRKIAVFDGTTGIVGGMNLADEYMGPSPSAERWRDLSLELRGSAVEVLDALVRADWEFACNEHLLPATQVGEGGDPGVSRDGADMPAPGASIPLEVVPTGPDAATDPLYDALLTAIYRAERHFWVSTPYFVPDEAVLHALRVAARRGVDVRIFVPDRSNHGIADVVAAPLLRELEGCGATIWRHRGMLHAKAVLVDDGLAMVGSANLDMRSLFLDYEIVLFLRESREVARLVEWFETTRANCTQGTARAGILQRRLEGFAWLLSPLV